PVRQATATALLAALRRDDDRLLLSKRDVARLAPAVEAWLERGTGPEAVRRALTARLPADPLISAASLLSYRLIESLPPPLPTAPPANQRPDPFQECPDCERPFRAPRPGRCRTCRAGSGADDAHDADTDAANAANADGTDDAQAGNTAAAQAREHTQRTGPDARPPTGA
ncbi:hypothetical protein NMN56_040785, partial [Streptomyces iconiensis]|nr:hypothetical protein [Streptomyces iconiensis]